MSGFVTGWIQDTFSDLASKGLKAVGGYAGDAICGIGDAVERSGQSVGTGLTKKYDVVGKKLSNAGGHSKPGSSTQGSKSQKVVAQRSSRPANSAAVPILSASKPPMVKQPQAPGRGMTSSKLSTGRLAASKPVSRTTAGKTTPITGKTTIQGIPQHSPKVVPSKESLPRAAARSKVQASHARRKSNSVVPK